MDSIKSKMKSLSEATAEATKRANIYEEETMRVNEMAEKLEEQVRKIIDQYAVVPMLVTASSFESRFETSRRRCRPWRANLTLVSRPSSRWG